VGAGPMRACARARSGAPQTPSCSSRRARAPRARAGGTPSPHLGRGAPGGRGGDGALAAAGRALGGGGAAADAGARGGRGAAARALAGLAGLARLGVRGGVAQTGGACARGHRLARRRRGWRGPKGRARGGRSPPRPERRGVNAFPHATPPDQPTRRMLRIPFFFMTLVELGWVGGGGVEGTGVAFGRNALAAGEVCVRKAVGLGGVLLKLARPQPGPTCCLVASGCFPRLHALPTTTAYLHRQRSQRVAGAGLTGPRGARARAAAAGALAAAADRLEGGGSDVRGTTRAAGMEGARPRGLLGRGCRSGRLPHLGRRRRGCAAAAGALKGRRAARRHAAAGGALGAVGARLEGAS
jgi:hypothetical protein